MSYSNRELTSLASLEAALAAAIHERDNGKSMTAIACGMVAFRTTDLIDAHKAMVAAEIAALRFPKIILRDMSKPVRARHSKHCGPYYWTPVCVIGAHPGRGFYSSSLSMLGMDRSGSTFRLRLEDAGTRREECYGHETASFYPIIARLPSNRGFLAGYTMGEGMLGALDGTIYRDEDDARRAARVEAEHARDRDAEYIEAEQAADAMWERVVEYEARVASPGKFEGEAPYVPYLWEEGGESDNPAAYSITPDDTAMFPTLGGVVYLYEDDQGFVHEIDEDEYNALNDAQNDPGDEDTSDDDATDCVVSIKLGNDAFADGNRGVELARILRDLADQIEHSAEKGYSARLMDSNGNACGTAAIY